MEPGGKRRFPILGIDWRLREDHPELPTSVPWSMIAPFEENARRNHDQSLEKLASRGGLSTLELIAVLDGHKLRWIRSQYESKNQDDVDLHFWKEIARRVEEFEGPQATEIEFLRWFYQNADFGGGEEGAKKAILVKMKEAFHEQTGKVLPKGY